MKQKTKVLKEVQTINLNKKKYKVSNWKEYNQSLKQRGSLEIWIDTDIQDKWYSLDNNGKNGTPFIYNDMVFEVLGKLKAIYNLKLRQLVGFAESILLKTNPKLQIPHFSTVSRRIGNIQVDLHKIKHSKGEKLIISIDGSGLKVYGESEWKVRQHGVGKRRVWKKIHLAVTETGEIEAVEVTNNNTHDKVLATKLLKQIENVSKVIFDGAYDHADIYLYCKEEKLEMIVPPRVDAVPWAADHPRTKAVEQIKRTSLDVWKNLSGYHARSVVENAFYRFKTVFGQHLSFRKDANQKIEVSLKCSILNQFYQLGRCASYVFNPVVI